MTVSRFSCGLTSFTVVSECRVGLTARQNSFSTLCSIHLDLSIRLCSLIDLVSVDFRSTMLLLTSVVGCVTSCIDLVHLDFLVTAVGFWTSCTDPVHLDFLVIVVG